MLTRLTLKQEEENNQNIFLMVKVMVHIAKAVVTVVMAFLCFSCGFDFKSIDGDGNVTVKSRTISGSFNSVTAGKGLEVIIEQGAQQSVTVEADDNLHQHIKTELKGNTLEITADTNIGNAQSKKITVVLPQIKSIESAGGSQVSSRGTLKEDSIELTSNGGSGLTVTIETRNLKTDASGGSHTSIKGTTENLEADASSGSSIDAENLKTENVRAESSSGSSITVNPKRNLTAEASSGAHIYYVSTPAQLKQNASSGGGVSQKQ